MHKKAISSSYFFRITYFTTLANNSSMGILIKQQKILLFHIKCEIHHLRIRLHNGAHIMKLKLPQARHHTS